MNIPKVLSSEEVYKGKIISIRKDTLTRGMERILSGRRRYPVMQLRSWQWMSRDAYS